MTDPVTTTSNVVTTPVASNLNGSATVGSTPVTMPDSAPVSAPDSAPDSAPVTTPDSAPEAPAQEPKNTTPSWAQERINELTAKRHQAEREARAEKERADRAEAANTELLKKMASGATPGTDPNPSPNPGMSQQEIDRMVQERAAQIAAQNQFNEACNNVADAGKKEFNDWDDVLKNLNLVGATGKDAPIEFLETAVELKNAHKVLHYLGTNLDQAEKVAKLPAKKMALEMARIEAMINAPAPAPAPIPVSGAPAPVIPVGGNTKAPVPDINDPNIASADWFALRDKQIAERRNRYQR